MTHVNHELLLRLAQLHDRQRKNRIDMEALDRKRRRIKDDLKETDREIASIDQQLLESDPDTPNGSIDLNTTSFDEIAMLVRKEKVPWTADDEAKRRRILRGTANLEPQPPDPEPELELELEVKQRSRIRKWDEYEKFRNDSIAQWKKYGGAKSVFCELSDTSRSSFDRHMGRYGLSLELWPPTEWPEQEPEQSPDRRRRERISKPILTQG